MQCQKLGIPIISAMGAGNKLDPTQFRVADIYKTKMDPLAKVMRHELKKRGINKLKVVYSEEVPIHPIGNYSNGEQDKLGSSLETDGHSNKKREIPGSTAFVPSVAGLIIAGEVIKDLTKDYIVKSEGV